MNDFHPVEIFKALSNETRLNILMWLKDPANAFSPELMQQHLGEGFDRSACVGCICEKAGVSQSVASQYLEQLRRVGLLESARFGKYTYYRRREDNIQRLAAWLGTEL